MRRAVAIGVRGFGEQIMGTPKQTWSRALMPGTPVDEAAAVVLTRRLGDVARFLPRAAGAKPGKPEAAKRVHALRVATRRAAAALDVFRESVARKDRKRIGKRLRVVRRAAALARDLDVQLELLCASARAARGASKDALTGLMREARAARRAAHEPLGRVAEKWPAKKLREQWGEMLARGHSERGRTLEHAAHEAVERAIERVEQAGAADLTVIEHVHVLRLKLKRLRYAMEAVGVCFGEAWKKRIQPQLVAVQGSLGELNDAHVLLTRLTGNGEVVGKRTRKTSPTRGIEAIKREQRAILAQAHAAFLEQWRTLIEGGFLSKLRQEIQGDRDARNGAAARERSGGNAQHGARTPGAAGVSGIVGIMEPKPFALGGVRAPGENAKHSVARGSGAKRRIAAIDVGTNSVRLIIAETSPDGSYRILDDEKEITRLGKGLSTTGMLAADSIEHTVVTIARMKSIAEGYGASEIQVVGTSAAREAKNASTLEKQIRERTGLELRVISGEEEAMLAYRSAAGAFDLAGVPGAVIDIGGGSTEIILSAAVGSGVRGAPPDSRRAGLGGGVIERVYSLPLGAVRLTDQFGGPEQCSGKRYAEMVAHIKSMLKEQVGRAPITPQLVIGTGGTLTTLASMVLQKEIGASGDGLFAGGVQGLEIGRADLKHLLEYLRKLPVKERTRVPGLSADRADIIIAGLAIIDGVLKRLGANRVRVHEGGIRDGILLGMVGGASDGPDGSAKRDPMRAVRRFAKSCAYEAVHAKHVTGLALRIFDQLAEQQHAMRLPQGVTLGPEQRMLLEAASLLHDIGYLINYAQHHKHSYHLIVHADLPGLTTSQVQVIANVARYHRAADPKPKHRAFAVLSEEDRATVRALSGILRVADGLDRTHMQNVRGLEVRIDQKQAFFEVEAASEPAVDLWGAVRKSGLFKEVFGLQPHFQWTAHEHVSAEAANTGPKMGRVVKQG